MDYFKFKYVAYHDEYKVMGLAPYSDADVNHDLYKILVNFFI